MQATLLYRVVVTIDTNAPLWRTFIRIFEQKPEDTFTRREKYPFKLDISRLFIRIFASMNVIHRPYYDFATFLARYFECKVQKISVHAGFTCPNRDGSKGVGGCSYCNNQTFNPDYCRPELSVTRQLEDGMRFFSHKYPSMRYLAYFQAYTNT